MQVALIELIAVTAIMNDDTFPTAWCVVVEKIVEHVVHPVASQNDGFLQGAFHQEPSINMQCCFVVEHECCPFGKREGCAFLDHERVVDDIRLISQERSVLLDDQAAFLYVSIDRTTA